METLRRLGFSAVFLFLTIVSCTPEAQLQVTQYPTFVATIPPPNVVSPKPMESRHSQIPSETQTFIEATNNQQGSNKVTPDRSQICPTVQKVAHNQLEIPLGIRLILTRNKDLVLLNLKNNTLTNIQVQGENPILSVPFRFQMSPDRKWFAYFSTNSSYDEENIYDLWVGSVDGREIWKAAGPLSSNSEIKWDKQDEIVVWQSKTPKVSCTHPMFQIFPFKKIVKPYYPEFQESGWPICRGSIDAKWVNPDYTRSIIYRSSGWKIFEYPSGIVQDAFFWLPETETELTRIEFKWTDQGINILIPSTNNLRFLIDLPPKMALERGVFLNEVDFHFPMVNEHIVWWSEDAHQIGFDLTTQLELNQQNAEKSFAIYNMEENALYNYCYDRGNALGAIYSSPDGRFLAWTTYEIHPSAVVILDSKTGRVTEIKSDYQVIGWGVTNDP